MDVKCLDKLPVKKLKAMKGTVVGLGGGGRVNHLQGSGPFSRLHHSELSVVLVTTVLCPPPVLPSIVH